METGLEHKVNSWELEQQILDKIIEQQQLRKEMLQKQEAELNLQQLRIQNEWIELDENRFKQMQQKFMLEQQQELNINSKILENNEKKNDNQKEMICGINNLKL
jgi:hypothetical protein